MENYPLLWNIRIFPIVIIITNLFFFGIGYLYLSTDTAFEKAYASSSFCGDYDTFLIVIYLASIVIGALIFIGWLIHYYKNKAFRVNYPRKTMYILEWLLCLIICVGITIIPLSLMEGSDTKWRTFSSKEDAKKAHEIIYQVDMLIPLYTYNYGWKEYMEPIRIPDGMSVNIDSSNINQYVYRKDNKNNLIIEGYIGPSLLFYKDDTYNRGSEQPTRFLTEKEKKQNKSNLG